MSQPAFKPSFQYTLTVLTGAEKGTVYRLMSKTATIGRGTDNDIVISSDPKSSRKHASISFTDNGVEIFDDSQKNKIYVDKKLTKRATLNNNAIIQLGDTQFQFKVLTNQSMVPSQSFANQKNGLLTPALPPQNSVLSEAPQEQNKLGHVGGIDAAPQSHRNKARKGNKLFFYSLVTILGVFGYLLLSDTKKASDENTRIRTELEIEKDIKEAKRKSDALRKQNEKSGKNTQQYKQAQSNFVQGFRDYRKGQFERSIVSFRACLALFPAHSLCKRYEMLARKKFNELIQYEMNLGKQYLDQNQFQACKAAFKNVIVMVKDPNNIIYKEAMKNFELCQQNTEGRF